MRLNRIEKKGSKYSQWIACCCGSFLFACCGMQMELMGQSNEDLPFNRYTTHSTLFGVGSSRLLDTYLSPIEYTGPSFHILRESLRKTHWLDGRVTTQSVLQGDFFFTQNPMQTGSEMGGNIDYSQGWHYNWEIGQGLRLMLGGVGNASLGCIYNSRNSNNLAQAKAGINIGASVMAIYQFKFKKTPFTARYQMNMPLIGAAFTPNYGQSYYEIFSQGNYDRNIRFVYPGNAPSFRQLLSFDFQVFSFTLRVGYLCDIRQSQLNNLKYHSYSHVFMLGYVKHFCFIKRNEKQYHKMLY